MTRLATRAAMAAIAIACVRGCCTWWSLSFCWCSGGSEVAAHAQPLDEEAGLDLEVALVQLVERRADGPGGPGPDRFREEGAALPGEMPGLAAVDKLLELHRGHRRPIGLGRGVPLQDVLGDVEAGRLRLSDGSNLR